MCLYIDGGSSMKSILVLTLISSLSLSAQVFEGNTGQQRFVNNTLLPILKMVMDAQLPYPEINKRILVQDGLIKKRFNGKKIEVRINYSYHNLSKQIGAASGILPDGNPGIAL